MIVSKLKIQASSLANAVFLCLLISLFCSSLLLIYQFKEKVKQTLELNTFLINRNNSYYNYLINNIETIPYNQSVGIDVFNDHQIYSYGVKKKWGLYDILITKTCLKKDTVIKTVLIAPKNKEHTVALYTTNYNKRLKVSGAVRIRGDIKVPDKKIEEVYINGVKGNKVSLKGVKKASANKLPKINTSFSFNIDDYDLRSLQDLEDTNYYNDFNKKTVLLNLDKIGNLEGVSLKGNIILYSKEVVKISKNNTLIDVLIVAPNVIIQSGFKGVVHVMATKKVAVKEDVSLLYPSSIYVYNDKDSTSVFLSKKCKILGNVIIDANSYKNVRSRQLIISEKTKIVGNVYCFGQTQLQGTIVGSIYSDSFFLKTKTKNYENVILNGSIIRDSLPNEFIELPLLQELKESTYGIIKEF